MNAKNWKAETVALHAGRLKEDGTLSCGTPVYRTSAFHFRDTQHAADLFALKELGNIYSRLGNPTCDVLEQRMTALEGGVAAVATASGMSAIHYTILNIARMGDEVVSGNNLYGGTYTMLNDILPQQGIRTRFVDISSADAVRAAINEKTRLIFCETIGNPALDVANLEMLAQIARENKLPLVVDSTFTPPTMLRPLDHGANIVVHSLTKWIGGHGAGMGGIVVDGGSFDWTDPKFTLYTEPEASYHDLRFAYDLGPLQPLAFALRFRLIPLRNLGACLSPDMAWIFIQGIETLALRMERHSSNALVVAHHLAAHPAVSWVRYPGLKNDPAYAQAQKLFPDGAGGMVVFGINGGEEAGRRFIEKLQLFVHVVNVGDVRSIATHPATTTHAQLSEEQQRAGGITPDLIRLSIGIEHIDDILADLDNALS